MMMVNKYETTRKNLDKRTVRLRYGAQFQSCISTIRESINANGQNERAVGNSVNGRSVGVYVRKRPVLDHEIARNEYDVLTCLDDAKTIVVHDCQIKPNMVHRYIDSHYHTFTKVFNETEGTETVYQDVVKPLIQHTLQGGKSVCLMYGQTGSGKTYTYKGFLKNVATDIFDSTSSFNRSIEMIAIELVGSTCYDLLNKRSNILLCESEHNELKLLNSQPQIIQSKQECVESFEEAINERATESTQRNSVSSRSHFICFLNVQEDGVNTGGQLVLLDLAGSERKEDQFSNNKERQRETIETNISHMALKRCLLAMQNNETNDATHIPFRNSSLTRILKGSLWSPRSKSAIVATLSPIPTDTEHTLHTLLHARKMLEENPVIEKVCTKLPNKEETSIKLLKNWNSDDIQNWLIALHVSKKYAMYGKHFNQLNGGQLVRLSVHRIIQMCSGNVEDGTLLFQSIRNEVLTQRKLIDLERRERLTGR